jgi:hypothetical protein
LENIVTGITEGTTYQVNIKVRSADDEVLIRYWDTRWYNDSDEIVGDDIDDSGYNPTTSDSWTDYGTPTALVTAPTGATKLRINLRVYVQSGYSAGVSYILVDDLTVTEATADPEPTNHVTNFTASTVAANSIELTWTGATGGQLPAGYLILGKKETGAYASVVDGTPVVDDQNWLLDHNAAHNVVHTDGANSYTFTKLNGNTEYDFIIYPYTNTGGDIDYKTDGTVPAVNTTTSDGAVVVGFEDFELGTFGIMSTYSVSSNKDWEIVNFGGAENTIYFTQINGYQQDASSNDWIISPPVNFDAYENKTLSFYTQYKYGSEDATNYLKCLYSSDYTGTGDPTAATWTELSYTQPSGEDTWTYSGDIDVSGISGDAVYLAMQYYSEDDPRRWGFDQVIIWGEPIGADIEPIETGFVVSEYKLYNNYPNPFNPSTTLKFNIPSFTENVELIIYDILGKKVQTLHSGSVNKGQFISQWNGTDSNGSLVPSGVYFAVLKTKDFRQAIKMMLMK